MSPEEEGATRYDLLRRSKRPLLQTRPFTYLLSTPLFISGI